MCAYCAVKRTRRRKPARSTVGGTRNAGLYRKRSFATHRQRPRPARAAACRIPCLILCLADVARVGQCRAPNAPCGVHGRMASVIAALVSRSRPPPPARASCLEHRIRQTSSTAPAGGRAPGALRRYQDSLSGHYQIENPGSLAPARYNAPATSDASSRPALLLSQTQAVFSVVAPCQ